MKTNPAAISAGHQVTAEAAHEILKAGGNAFDAAIAAYVTSFVSEPFMASGGGGAFANILTANGDAWLFDFFCQTPLTKRKLDHVDFYPVHVDFGGDTESFHIGKGSSAVPGSIAGIFDIHEKLGSIPIHELFQPAIAAAKNGVKINEFLSLEFQLLGSIFGSSEEGRNLFHKDGELKKLGDLILMPGLADFLDYLGKEGKDAFYKGEIADKIAKDYQEGGGFLTHEDLAQYQTVIRKPLTFKYRGKTILTNPFPSTGGSLIALILGYLQDDALVDHLSEPHILAFYEALKKVDQLKGHPHAIAGQLSELYNIPPSFQQNPNKKWGSTSHFNIMDKWGNVISLTTTIGEGCGYFIEGTDIQMNNMLGEAALLPNGFHSWTPNTRLSSMMAPTIVKGQNGQPEIILGSGGASRIPSAIAQVLAFLIDYNIPLEDALQAPRVHFEHGKLSLEKGFHAPFEKQLEDVAINNWDKKHMFFGGVHAIHNFNNQITAAGDPRRFGVGII